MPRESWMSEDKQSAMTYRLHADYTWINDNVTRITIIGSTYCVQVHQEIDHLRQHRLELLVKWKYTKFADPDWSFQTQFSELIGDC